jgi:hypothetical protein
MDWFEKFLAALGSGGGGELDSAMMAAGSTPVTYNPADYSGLDAAMMAAGSTPVSYGGSSDTPFYLRPGFLQGAGSAIGGLGQAYAGSRAAGAQVDAANLAIQEQRRVRDENIAMLQPRLTAGNNALAQMQSGAFAQPAPFVYNPNKYTASPGYDFRRNQGLLALDRTAAANAGLQSGAALKAAARFGGDLAAQDQREFDARDYARALDAYNSRVAQSNTGYNRLAGLADIGQTAGTQIGATGQNYATNFGNLTGQAGQATGASYLGAGNSLNNLGVALNQQYNTNQMMDILRRSSYA